MLEPVCNQIREQLLESAPIPCSDAIATARQLDRVLGIRSHKLGNGLPAQRKNTRLNKTNCDNRMIVAERTLNRAIKEKSLEAARSSTRATIISRSKFKWLYVGRERLKTQRRNQS